MEGKPHGCRSSRGNRRVLGGSGLLATETRSEWRKTRRLWMCFPPFWSSVADRKLTKLYALPATDVHNVHKSKPPNGTRISSNLGALLDSGRIFRQSTCPDETRAVSGGFAATTYYTLIEIQIAISHSN